MSTSFINRTYLFVVCTHVVIFFVKGTELLHFANDASIAFAHRQGSGASESALRKLVEVYDLNLNLRS